LSKSGSVAYPIHFLTSPNYCVGVLSKNDDVHELKRFSSRTISSHVCKISSHNHNYQQQQQQQKQKLQQQQECNNSVLYLLPVLITQQSKQYEQSCTNE